VAIPRCTKDVYIWHVTTCRVRLHDCNEKASRPLGEVANVTRKRSQELSIATTLRTLNGSRGSPWRSAGLEVTGWGVDREKA